MASSSQRVYTSCSLFLSLSGFNSIFLWSRGSTAFAYRSWLLYWAMFSCQVFDNQEVILANCTESTTCVQRRSICVWKLSENIGMRKPYTNICTSYVVSVSNAPRVAFDCLCFTYITVHVKLKLTYYKFTWMYCKSVYVNTCSTFS